jgi:hypothetical protein
VVVNRTTEPLTLRYGIDARDSAACLLAPPYLDAPPVFSTKKVGLRRILDSVAPATEFKVDEGSCSITLQLSPNQGVVVWKEIGFFPETGPGPKRFLSRLQLSGPRSTVEYAGADLYRDFERHSDALYVLEYRPTNP